MSNPDSARCLDVFQPICHRDFVRTDGGIHRREVVAALKPTNNQNRPVVHPLRMNFVDVVEWKPGDIETRHHEFPLLNTAQADENITARNPVEKNQPRLNFRFRAAPLIQNDARSHPRARKTTDVIHTSTPTAAAITTTIIKSSQSQLMGIAS